MGRMRLSSLVLTLGVLLSGCELRVTDGTPVTKKRTTPAVAPRGPLVSVTPVPLDRYLSIEEIAAIETAWANEARGLVEMGSVGTTSKGTNIPYLKFGRTGPEILIHAAVHGNERIPVSCTLGFMERLLREYGRDAETTQLLNTRQIYFVPVLSVDSYVSRQRHVDGVDPNRNFVSPSHPESRSPGPVAAVQNFAKLHQFKGYISGHSVGRIYLYPSLGDLADKSQQLANEMAGVSGYTTGRIGGDNGYDINGFCWQYHCVSVLIEFGHGSHEMNPRELQAECERNIGAFKLFIKRAPEFNP